MKHRLATVCSLALFAFRASGQGEVPEFEVAAVKQVAAANQRPLQHLPAFVAEKMGFSGGPGSKDPGRIDYSKVTLKMLLARAYDVKPQQVTGPGWLDTEQYTIAATLAPGTSAAQLRLMLQKLLTERFQISLHREVKEMAVYRLKVAKNGPKLQPAKELPERLTDEERTAATRKLLEENVARMKASRTAVERSGVKPLNTRQFGMTSATMEKFAEMLGGHLDRPVRDLTELKGKYSFQLEWNPDGGVNDELGISIFTAIQQQLGLRLEAGKESAELLVIDKAGKVPVSN